MPPIVYNALRTTFRKLMRNYPMTSPISLLDTCYDLSKSKSVSIPHISFLFGGDVSVDLDKVGIFYMLSPTQACLAFAGNSDPSNMPFLGMFNKKG